jgi:hypothetical protein
MATSRVMATSFCPFCGRVLNRYSCPIHGIVRGESVLAEPVSAPITGASPYLGEHSDLSGLSDDDHGQYWHGSSHNSITVSDTEPTSPTTGDIWIDTSGL